MSLTGSGSPTDPNPLSAPRRVFVACSDSTVSVFDVDQASVIGSVPLQGRPISVVASPDGDRIFVGLAEPGGIVEIDPENLQILRALPTPSMSFGLDITPDGRVVLGTNQEEGLITVVSVATWELLDTIRIGLSPQYLSVDPSGERAYVPLFGNDQLAVLNLGSRSVESFLPLGNIEQGPVGVAVSPDGGTVYVGTWARDEDLLVVSTYPPVLFRRVKVGPATVDLESGVLSAL